MSIVEVLRHSYKEGKRLSEEGRLEAFRKGQELRVQYPDTEINFFGTNYQSEPGYQGRVADTAECENAGAGNSGRKITLDNRLVPEYDAEDYKAAGAELKANPDKTEIEVIYAIAKYSIFSNARKLAQFIEEKVRNNDVDVPTTNSPTPQGLAYLISGLDASLLITDCDPLKGLSIEYDEANDVYKVELSYHDGRVIEVKGSLVAKCDEMIEKERRQDENAKQHAESTLECEQGEDVEDGLEEKCEDSSGDDSE